MIQGQPRERVYGPVPSRRFGLSLGVDLVPHKVCCYDCVYCQVGRTTDTTVTRRDFYPLDTILADIARALEERPRPDVITLAGSGEPTLYRSLGGLVRRIRSSTSIPIVLLTGGGMLMDEDVAADALTVDILAPSLDAGTEEQFAAINCPCSSLRFASMVEGLSRVVSAFTGEVRLEVMLIPELNADEESILRIASLTRSMPLAAIDLNTPVRPPHASGVGIVSATSLAKARAAFGPLSRVIGNFSGVTAPSPSPASSLRTLVVETLARRPCTTRDLLASLACESSVLRNVLDRLMAQGVVEERRSRDEVYFWAPGDPRPGRSTTRG
ncbi:radical SAM protein [Candidatus Fermentibacteria bacterium]|nr:radical SAM protein [Candidatus Fermentibacteria bacterium]